MSAFIESCLSNDLNIEEISFYFRPKADIGNKLEWSPLDKEAFLNKCVDVLLESFDKDELIVIPKLESCWSG